MYVLTSRLPKRLQTSKSQENSKKNLLKKDTQGASFSCKRTSSTEGNSNVPQLDSSHAKPGNETSMENCDLQEIEKTLCAESEKLCPSCKAIVPHDMFVDHFKDCIQKFKLSKEGCVKQIPVSVKEGETSEQEDQQPVLPCPVCKKVCIQILFDEIGNLEHTTLFILFLFLFFTCSIYLYLF